jgi:LSD1 subclass zinc finger protein
MPIYKEGYGNWVKKCEVCRKPFIKKRGTSQKKCEMCRRSSGGVKCPKK